MKGWLTLMINQSKPCLEASDFDYIQEILVSGQIAAGPIVEKLENDFSIYHGLKYSVAVSSGTAALHLALLAMGISEGDEVIIPSYTCSAVLNAVNYTGAAAVPADIDPETLNITSTTIKPLVTPRTKAIIVTHTFGFPADTNDISMLGIPVIEDCAHAVGARYLDRPCGCAGRVSILSFYATKMLGAGEGGMIFTNSEEIALNVRDLNCPDMRDDYRVRYNYKMSDLTAGLALNQLKKIDFFLTRRRYIADKYQQTLAKIPGISFQKAIKNSMPVFYRFVILTEQADRLIAYAEQKGVICDRPVYKPIHQYLDLPGYRFPATETTLHNCVSIPIYPAISDNEVYHVIDTVVEGMLQIRRG